MPAGDPIDLLTEWQECRSTIGRIDGYLVDTRKYGFTLVTLLLTASALVTTRDPVLDRVAASVVVMTLLLTLFLIDLYWWVLLRGANGRAARLENDAAPGQLLISGELSARAKVAHSTRLAVVIYILFVAVASALPLATVWLPQPDRNAWTWTVVVAGYGVVVVVMMWVVRTRTDNRTTWTSYPIAEAAPEDRSRGPGATPG